MDFIRSIEITKTPLASKQPVRNRYFCETIITPALPCQYHFAQVGIRSTLEFATRKQRFKILVRNWRTMSTENKRPALAKTEKYELDLDIESRMPGAKNVFLARPNDCML